MGETAQVFPRPGQGNSAGVSPRSFRYFPLREEGTIARQQVGEIDPEPTLRHLIKRRVCLTSAVYCLQPVLEMNGRTCGTRVVKSVAHRPCLNYWALLLAVRGRLHWQRNVISFVSILK